MTARWRGHEHRELYDMINSGPGAGASDAQNQYWSSLTTELKDIDDQLNKALGDMKATWEGTAAASADSGTTPLQKWAGDAQTGSSVMHASTVDQAEFVSTARAEMPEPVEVTTPKPSGWQMFTAGAAALTGDGGPAAAVAAQAADHEHQEAVKAAAAQKAVDTMTTYESNSTWNRNTLGTFVPPPNVVVEAAPPPGGATVGGPVGSAAGFGDAPGTREGRAQDSITYQGPPGGGNGYHAPPPPPGGGSGAPGTGGSGSPVAPGQNSGTDPSFGFPAPPPGAGPYPAPPPPPSTGPGTGPGWGYPPPGSGYPLPVGGLPGDPSGGTSNLSNRPGGPGSFRGGPGGAPGLGGPDGRGGIGGPGGLDADGARSAAQLGRGGAAGIGEGVLGRGGPGGGAAGARGGGMSPMGGGGGYADGDEDEEHRTPGYLLETTDVFGDARMVSPAVIGEDPDSEEM